MADRETLVAMVKGLDDHLVEIADKSIRQILRHAQQEELPTVPQEECDTKLVEGNAVEYKGQMTIWGMFVKLYQPQRLVGKSKETPRLYGISVRHFSRWLGRPALLSDLTDERVSEFATYRSQQGLSMHTVKKDITQILCLWRYAALRRLVPQGPSIREPDAADPVPDAWTREELQRLISHVRTLDGDIGDVPARLFWEGIIAIILDTGERIGAVRRVKWNQIDSEGWLIVPPESRKGRKKGKRFKLSPETLSLLAKMRPFTDGETLFVWPQCDMYIYTKFNNILKGCGLSHGRRDKFHKLRRTTATYYEAAGGDATKLLGHSARSVTNRYIDERFVSTPQPADIVPNLLTKDVKDAQTPSPDVDSKQPDFSDASAAQHKPAGQPIYRRG